MQRGLWLATPGFVLAAAALLVAAEGPSPTRVQDAVLAAAGVVMMWSTAVAVRLRYPERPLAWLLFALALGYAMQPFASSPNAVLFTAARAARPAVEVLLVWVMLAFPSGRLAGWRERALVVAAALDVLLLWLPGMMFSPRVPLPGPFVTCGAQCPDNLLFLADRPDWSNALLQAFRGLGVAILALTSLHLFVRLRRASKLMRRALAPVLLASIARALNVAWFLVIGGTAAAMTFTFCLVPLAIWLGLLRGRLYTARALQHLVGGMQRRPQRDELRRVMATALDDPSLELGYWREADRAWVDAQGRVLALPSAGDPARASRIVHDAAQQPVAVLLHDPALLEEPTLLDAVAGSMRRALEDERIELALAAERGHTASAVESERRRIERDLHDGAQQRLLALRMKAGVVRRLMDVDPSRAASMIDELGGDIDAAVGELRALAHGIVPPLLVDLGLRAALAEAARRMTLQVTTDLAEVGRCAPSVERAIYFCCMEALQNAAKHAGPDAAVQLALGRQGDVVTFTVRDNGKGRPSQTSDPGGQGLANMHERVRAVGGRLEVTAPPGGGYMVSGAVAAGGA